MVRLIIAILATFALCAGASVHAVEGTVSVAKDGRLEFSTMKHFRPFDRADDLVIYAGGATDGPRVTVDGCADLGGQFAPWFVSYATAVDKLARAIDAPADSPADLEPGAALRAEARRLDAIHKAAAVVRELHAKVRIHE